MQHTTAKRALCPSCAGLAQYTPQSNNFVVFSSYFHNASLDSAGSPWVTPSVHMFIVAVRPCESQVEHELFVVNTCYCAVRFTCCASELETDMYPW